MDSRAALQSGAVARLRIAPPAGSDGARTALALARAHPFTLERAGELAFDDPASLERALFFASGTLPTTRAGWHALLSPADRRARTRALEPLSWAGARMSLDYAVADGQGGTRSLREVVEAQDDTDNPGALVLRGVLLDRTQDAELLRRCVWDARHDALTGLDNRAALSERAGVAAALGARLGARATLVQLRLLNLGTLTRTYGPDCAERLLCGAAERLRDTVRQPDAAARLDGPDFAVVLLGDGATGARARIESALTDTPYSTPFGPLYLDVKLAERELRPLPGAVDAALDELAAELDGTGSPLSRPARAGQSAPDVLAALDGDTISLAFQPIVDAKTGRTHHHECLLRVRAPSGRMISAGPIVQHAERLGLVSQLDERALELAAPHLRATPDLHLALNISAGTLGDERAARRYLDRLRALGDMAARITIEMTETLAVDDPAAAARFSSDVRQLGCQFAVDDFGSGYTTFRNLMAVEADSLKIDGELVRGISVDAGKQTFMRMMVDLAQTFGVSTVAEMVENEADAAMLRRLGVDYLQGYHFGYPAPAPVWSRMGQS